MVVFFKKNGTLKAIAITSCTIAIAIILYLVVFSPVVVNGVVEAKSIMGVKGDTSFSIITIMPNRVYVDDPAFSQVVVNEGAGLTINSTLEQMMLDAGYSQIKYVITIALLSGEDTVHHISPGQALGYFTERIDFNALRIWDVAEFQVDRFDFGAIHLVD
jgi:hypothetical protein